MISPRNAHLSTVGVRGIASLLFGALLSACASSTDLVKPCCYIGSVTLARLHDLKLSMENGRIHPFAEIFPRFHPRTGLAARVFPFARVDIRSVTYSPLDDLMPDYDANRNTVLEEPELAVLYLRESARGLGRRVEHVGGATPIRALALARADISGLMRFVETAKPEMNARAREIFDELELLGIDLRTNGIDHGDGGDHMAWGGD